MTAQTTLAATAARDAAFRAAIARIEAIMLPGARALAATRTPGSPYWITEERDLSRFAPFANNGRTLLIWQDQGSSAHVERSPYDVASGKVSYSVQVVVDLDASPMVISELARLAALYTAEIVRKSDILAAAQTAELDSERAEFDRVAAVP